MKKVKNFSFKIHPLLLALAIFTLFTGCHRKVQNQASPVVEQPQPTASLETKLTPASPTPCSSESSVSSTCTVK